MAQIRVQKSSEDGLFRVINIDNLGDGMRESSTLLEALEIAASIADDDGTLGEVMIDDDNRLGQTSVFDDLVREIREARSTT